MIRRPEDAVHSKGARCLHLIVGTRRDWRVRGTSAHSRGVRGGAHARVQLGRGKRELFYYIGDLDQPINVVKY